MDLNTFAKSIVEQAIGEKPVKAVKSPEAVKRGKARIESMGGGVSEHARAAANKRWHPERETVK